MCDPPSLILVHSHRALLQLVVPGLSNNKAEHAPQNPLIQHGTDGEGNERSPHARTGADDHPPTEQDHEDDREDGDQYLPPAADLVDLHGMLFVDGVVQDPLRTFLDHAQGVDQAGQQQTETGGVILVGVEAVESAEQTDDDQQAGGDKNGLLVGANVRLFQIQSRNFDHGEHGGDTSAHQDQEEQDGEDVTAVRHVGEQRGQGDEGQTGVAAGDGVRQDRRRKRRWPG